MIVSTSEYMQLMEEAGAPTVLVLSCHWHRARKDHGPCARCGKPILSGERYGTTAMLVDGEFYASKAHSDWCDDPDAY